jgi:hypothetical protein
VSALIGQCFHRPALLDPERHAVDRFPRDRPDFTRILLHVLPEIRFEGRVARRHRVVFAVRWNTVRCAANAAITGAAWMLVEPVPIETIAEAKQLVEAREARANHQRIELGGLDGFAFHRARHHIRHLCPVPCLLPPRTPQPYLPAYASTSGNPVLPFSGEQP